MKKGLVLLVDDEPVVLQMHAAVVRQFGFETLMADSAEEALYIAKTQSLSLIFSDVQMPGEGGFDFVASLVERGLKQMPVVYLTGYNDIDIIRGGLRAGGDDFIIKGSSIEVFRRRIAFWMASGFDALPNDVRRRALILANAVSGDSFAGIKEHFGFDAGVLERVQKRILAELKDLPISYGVRLVDRVCFMGRLSNMLIMESREFDDLIRFPDHMDTIIRHLDVPWAKDMWPLFKHFTDWAGDVRFILAGVEPLKPHKEYDWVQETVA
ncbi:MAG: response regulator [Kordiimonadaceae bacterium]|nr:response regulator [Kordiimonadaceae bacterium]